MSVIIVMHSMKCHYESGRHMTKRHVTDVGHVISCHVNSVIWIP